MYAALVGCRTFVESLGGGNEPNQEASAHTQSAVWIGNPFFTGSTTTPGRAFYVRQVKLGGISGTFQHCTLDLCVGFDPYTFPLALYSTDANNQTTGLLATENVTVGLSPTPTPFTFTLAKPWVLAPNSRYMLALTPPQFPNQDESNVKITWPSLSGPPYLSGGSPGWTLGFLMTSTDLGGPGV